MNTALWVAQFLLAALFMLVGIMKLMMSREQAMERARYMEDLTEDQVRWIGTLEVLGAIGLIAPAVTGILPWLTPLAGVGFALTMVGATLLHWRRGEYPPIVMNLVLLGLAVFVAYGRFVVEPL
jgi:uncharacterized membrane protein YphA (DoxX/SURF4 family)